MSEKGPATGSALPQGCGFFLGLTQHPDRDVNLGLLRKSFFIEPLMHPLAIIPIPALQDNYIWAIVHIPSQQTLIVDPGESRPVIDFLQQHQYHLMGILLTHHHGDHTQGVPGLLEQFPDIPVWGSVDSSLPIINHPIHHQPEIVVNDNFPSYIILKIPGHTLDHIAYWDKENARLFCGDTLFAAGCGRAFEGTLAQLYDSLQRLAALPDHTHIYCAHEYTLKNLEFAQRVDPHNQAVSVRQAQIKSLRNTGLPSLPSTLLEEKATNPFLRCNNPEIIATAQRYAGKTLSSPVEVFSTLREWKNIF